MCVYTFFINPALILPGTPQLPTKEQAHAKKLLVGKYFASDKRKCQGETQKQFDSSPALSTEKR